MRIVIRSVPHWKQRYDTAGDYYETGYWSVEGGSEEGLDVVVSELADRREMLLVAIHELVEWALCEARGITNKQIDDFDLSFDPKNDDGVEPGDSPRAPYYRQHQIASGIERMLAAELNVDWLTYERHIKELK